MKGRALNTDRSRGERICEENDVAVIDTGAAGLDSMNFSYVNENGKPYINL